MYILNVQFPFCYTFPTVREWTLSYSEKSIRCNCTCRATSIRTVHLEITDSNWLGEKKTYTTTDDVNTTSIRICHQKRIMVSSILPPSHPTQYTHKNWIKPQTEIYLNERDNFKLVFNVFFIIILAWIHYAYIIII